MTDDLETLVHEGRLYAESMSSVAHYAVYDKDGVQFLGYTDTVGAVEYDRDGKWIGPYAQRTAFDAPQVKVIAVDPRTGKPV